MSYLIILALSFQCMMDSLQQASKVHIEIEPKWRFKYSKPANYTDQVRFLQQTWIDEKPDPRLLALAWMESRIRPNVGLGDNGRACGLFQIHARYSYPQFIRGHWNDWDEKEHQVAIQKECTKLKNPDSKYSVQVMRKYLSIFDEKGLHPCHHQSGVKGTCDSWYKSRLDYWITFFQYKLVTCSDKGELAMAMMRTGTPASATPIEMVQGYLDGMQGKPMSSEADVYKTGYELALKVKKGEAEAPAWAVTSVNG